MRYEFRLAELLGHTPDRRKRPGTIKAIVEYTGLDRHQVASLLKNEAKYIPLEALSRLCDYLVEHGYANADELPGALFSVKPEHFWELLARRRRLEICVGVRRPGPDNAAESAMVVASDAVLMGEVLNGVTTLGGTDKLARSQVHSREMPTHPELLKQALAWSPGIKNPEASVERSRKTYAEFDAAGGDKALIVLGSVKSNPIADIVIGDAFLAKPFETQDDCQDPQDRSCPFFLRYREHDPHLPCASAGIHLSKSQASEEPGIYYETENGSWEYVGVQDAALVFYIYRESLGRLEMVLSGFSGRATRLLARTLANRSEEFWPPVYQENYLQIGAYIVKYEASAEDQKPEDILRTDEMGNPTIFPIPREAIARRFRTKSN